MCVACGDVRLSLSFLTSVGAAISGRLDGPVFMLGIEILVFGFVAAFLLFKLWLLYTSDAADDYSV